MKKNNCKSIIELITDKLEHMGLVEDEQFNIFYIKEGKVKTKEKKEIIKVQFQLKGNQNIIHELEEFGFKIEKRYRSLSGNPQIYDEKPFNTENYSNNVVMVRMEFLL
jgi:hypothetical protein